MVRPAMSGEGHQPDQQPGDSDPHADHQRFANAAWSIPSYLLSGMAVYGGLGWLLDRWLGTSALLPIGILVGLGLALYSVYLRFGR
ncbi:MULTISPECIES: AtpZ/AtpI family protein [Thermomonospora]|uniref:F0F1-type ATP synthase assembly protein I n=1 Tax=Thermomonospora cellulosilytica TaxID=1411118 RepID=A0A7W3N547_9ACTN|nr:MULTISPECIES: AtpZ/AtpI family protein [Thermomonospora]MBA9007714.1 F0F1-type ATP synthase assembly protein I [Thermomonospora cellulosilytica]